MLLALLTRCMPGMKRSPEPLPDVSLMSCAAKSTAAHSSSEHSAQAF